MAIQVFNLNFTINLSFLEFRTLMQSLESIQVDIQKNYKEIRDVKTTIETLAYNLKLETPSQTFTDKYKITLPISDRDLFIDFEEILQNPDIQAAFVSKIII